MLPHWCYIKISKVSNAIYQGEIVKPNGTTNRDIRTYLRSSTDLLEDISEQLKLSKFSEKDLKIMLTRSIEISAKEGHPFIHIGESGIFKY